MTPREIAVAMFGVTAALLTAVGLLRRGRWRIAWFFSAYVAAVLVIEALITFWPTRFWTFSFWVVKQAVYDILKLGIALEFGWRTFQPFPGAGLTARRMASLILLATAFTVVLALARWYRVPVHPFHAAILTGFVAYLAVCSLENTLAHLYGYDTVRPFLAALDPAAFFLMILWWVYVSWRPDDAATLAHGETLQRLQMRVA